MRKHLQRFSAIIAIVLALTSVVALETDHCSAKGKKMSNYEHNARAVYKILRKDYHLSANGAITVVAVMGEESKLSTGWNKKKTAYGLMRWTGKTKKNVLLKQKFYPWTPKLILQTDFFMTDIYFSKHRKSVYGVLTYTNSTLKRGQPIMFCAKSIKTNYLGCKKKTTAKRYAKRVVNRAIKLQKQYKLTW